MSLQIDKNNAVEFYDHRYEEGYMEDWDDLKKRKVRELIAGINLPQYGKALDFGCGNGVFTKIIKEVLPQWDVYGTEISHEAVNNAGKKHKECIFFTDEEASKYRGMFDFLFSHHVIEHVTNLEESFSLINDYLKESSVQLHILPCGNQGSYEYEICQKVKGGIEKEKGNRFFFEEPGHLRRLTTDEFVEQEKKYGFGLIAEYYSNQKAGAINWITKSSPRFVKRLTNPANAISSESKIELIKTRKKLLPLTYLQFAYSKYWSIKSKWRKSIKDYLKLVILFFPSLVSRFFYSKWEKAASAEWDTRKTEKNGSEMYLVFHR